jgi:hypothetical protein
MKTIVAAFGLVVLICSTAQADMVYGVIKADGKVVGKGIKVEVLTDTTVSDSTVSDTTVSDTTVSDSNVIDSTTTDEKGAYRLMIKGRQEVVFRITYGGQTPTIRVFTYDRPVRYNIILEKVDGRYRARRE